jgi:hypothetical protein
MILKEINMETLALAGMISIHLDVVTTIQMNLVLLICAVLVEEAVKTDKNVLQLTRMKHVRMMIQQEIHGVIHAQATMTFRLQVVAVTIQKLSLLALNAVRVKELINAPLTRTPTICLWIKCAQTMIHKQMPTEIHVQVGMTSTRDHAANMTQTNLTHALCAVLVVILQTARLLAKMMIRLKISMGIHAQVGMMKTLIHVEPMILDSSLPLSFAAPVRVLNLMGMYKVGLII